MTIEEQLKKLTEEHQAAQAEIDKLQKNQSAQNSHITKLEAENKELKKEADGLAKQAQQAPGSKNSNSAYEKYMRNKWRSEVVDNALESLKGTYDAKHVDLLRDDVVEYCKKNMTDETTHEKFAKKVFAMLYGEALGDKQHAIHQTDTPPKDPEPQKPDPKNPKPLHDTLTPHTMTPGDNPANPGNVPPGNPSNYKDTKDSFKALQSRLQGINTDS